jgi:hypothetical protein
MFECWGGQSLQMILPREVKKCGGGKDARKVEKCGGGKDARKVEKCGERGEVVRSGKRQENVRQQGGGHSRRGHKNPFF